MVKRSLEVSLIGSQRFEQRFPGKRRRLDDDLPQIANWRCNLTALSTSTNLCFVAYCAEIYIYEPSFPSQCLSDPVLIIPSRPSANDLHGHLDDVQPNSVNNLLVSFLGAEEVIATVRDDGDTDIYLLRHILHAIHVRSQATEKLSVIADELRPIFQRNVGASAWGLAIHSQARVFAVSSNSHELRVFRFGLVSELHQAGEDDGDRPYDAEEWVANGEANIPCISFCNTGDDPTGRWLITTDISGVCRTLDLDHMIFTQSFGFMASIDRANSIAYDRLNAGWSILFLDRKSFADAPDLHSALGLKAHEALPDTRDSPHIWDLSRTVKSVPDSDAPFVVSSWQQTRPATMVVAVRDTTAIEQGDESVSDQDDSDLMGDASSYAPSSIDEASELTTPMPYLTDELDDYGDEGTEDSSPFTAYYGGERIRANYPRFSKLSRFCNGLPCPILHASVRNIYLLQPTDDASDTYSRPPLVGMAAPLKQQLDTHYSFLNQYERLNMTVYIPDLGVVLVGTQKGRVLLLALTKLGKSIKYPKELEALDSRTNYSMRVETILPTSSEEHGLRPFAPFHGIAAAPMQGCPKRWRLMLMYQDHTVLAYEIGKKQNKVHVKVDSMIV